jgi:hypothetical protein
MADGFFADIFDTTGSPAADDGIHYPQDQVNYHELSYWVSSPDGIGTFNYPFRCDAASYVN